jgi:hypothetical protein
MIYSGDYNFFDYKYNIIGYNGQDFGGFPQYLYLIISGILIVTLLFSLRKIEKKQVLKILRILGIFMTTLYIVKTTWESIYDIRLTGSFNWGLLPLDTCSIIMPACLIAGFGRGKLQEMANCWLMTGSIIGGLGTMVILNAFKYYPFLSFGAFYSMIWHFLMVFIGLLLIVTNYVDMKYSIVIKGFIFHLIISLFVIPFDFIFNFDFMMYKDLGSIPFFENIAGYFTSINLSFLNPFMMLILYFVSFNIIFGFIKLFKKKKTIISG